ncbi:MAG: hypothetical protein ACLFP1_02330 [Candidatus Goldiibacteriota bacterium]
MMKGLVSVLAVVAAIFLFFVVGAENVSEKFENYIQEKVTDEDEKQHLKVQNIRYVYLAGKYERAEKLIKEFLDKYDRYDEYSEDDPLGDRVAFMHFMLGQVYDRQIRNVKAKFQYKKYIERFPNAENVEKAKKRIREIL